MLILSRKEDELIKLGDDIIIKVVSVNKGSVKIGIDAPRDMMILRGELIREIASENMQASKQNGEDIASLSEKLKQ